MSRHENHVSKAIIDCAFKIHKMYGPGLLENFYEEVLCMELIDQNLKVEKQKPISVFHEGKKVEIAYRIDLLVEDQIIVELKAIERTLPIHRAQLMSYLRLSEKKIGLLINFNSLLLKDGLERIVI